MAAAATALDSMCYGRLELVPWNFFRFNVLAGGGSHYGTHVWHWYLTNVRTSTSDSQSLFVPGSTQGSWAVASNSY